MAREMKDSGVEWIGRIPATWNIVAYKYCCSLQAGCPFDSSLFSNLSGFPLIRIRDITSGIVQTFYTGEYDDSFIVHSGDLLVGMDGDFNIRWWHGKDALLNQRCCRIYEKENVTRRFLYYVLPFTLEYINTLAYATTVKHLSNGNILNSWIAIPGLDIQKQVTQYLDKICVEIDAVMEKTRASIEEYKKLKQAIITQAVTKGVRGDRPMKDSGSIWFGFIPADWGICKTKKIVTIEKRIAGAEGLTVLSITQKGIRPKDLSKNEGQLAASYSNYQIVHPGDFAMNHMDLLTGWIDISRFEGVTSPDYRVFTMPVNNGVNKRYYLYLFQMCYFNRIYYGLGQGVSGLGRWRLPANQFLNFLIPVPPIEEQNEIVEYLNRYCTKIDTLIQKKQKFLGELESYRKSLIYEYVTGKKEVPPAQFQATIAFVDTRALLLCRIIELLNPKGRIHLMKALFTVDCLLDLNSVTQYQRQKHGPYDVRIEEYEQVMEQNGWVSIKKGSPVNYVLNQEFEKYQKPYQIYFGKVDEQIQRICAFLRPMKTSKAERVATLLAAWNDFIMDGMAPTDQQIVQEVRSNWTPNKAHSSEATWLGTLSEMKEHQIIPFGHGKHTIHM